MGERTSYAPGTFCWADLSTTDQTAAKAFYGGLFGWEATDMPVDDTTVYSMMQIDGRDVAAIAPQPPQQRDAGAPPAWNSYIRVQSADDALERARQLGATVHAPAFDVMEAGRMGVVQDPQGAFFLAWEPKRHIGAALVNAPGALSWDELGTTDMDASARFYSQLFEWTVEPFEAMEMPYATIKNSEGWNNGGMRPVMGPEEPPHWLAYFGTEDIDAALAKASDGGGSPLAGPIEIGMGKVAVLADPQGAVFALYAGQFEP